MPEAPELVAIWEFLLARLVGDEIAAASERKPLVLRNTQDVDFESDLRGRRVESIERHGKLLEIGLSGNRELIISPILTGALMGCDPETRMMARLFWCSI
jgi:formamidopyrimidine-DNA glycosylase